MIDRDFYTRMINMHADHEGYEAAQDDRESTLNSILDYIELQMKSAYGKGKVAGLERASQINRDKQ